MATKKYQVVIDVEYASSENFPDKLMESELEESIQRSIDHNFFLPKNSKIQVATWNSSVNLIKSKK